MASQCNFLHDPTAVRLALCADRPHCQAGSVVTGRVYLSLPGDDDDDDDDGRTLNLPKNAQLRLILEGSEHTVSASDAASARRGNHTFDRCHHKDHHAGANKNHHHNSMESSKTLILTDCIPAVSLPATTRKAAAAAATPVGVDVDAGGGGDSDDDATHTINQGEAVVVSASALCFEYPFQWQLPAHLPTSLFCFESESAHGSAQANNYSESLAEIRYTLSATIIADAVSISGGEQPQYPTAETVLYVAAKGIPTNTDDDHDTTTTTTTTTIKNNDSEDPTTAPTTTSNPGCLVHPQVFFVRNNDSSSWWGCWRRRWKNPGMIRLGWETDQSIYSPGNIVTVHVTLDHPISVVEPCAVRLIVSCLETVTWSHQHPEHHPDPHSVSRCLAQHVVPHADWKHRDHCSDTSAGTSSPPSSLVQLWGITARIRLPTDARDSYTGGLVTVHHCLVVSVDTATDSNICNNTWNRRNKNKNSGKSCCGNSVTPQAVGPIQIIRRGVCAESAVTTATTARTAKASSSDDENTATTKDATETERDKLSVAQELTGWRPVLREKQVQQEFTASGTTRCPEQDQEQQLDDDPKVTTPFTPSSSILPCSDNLAFLLAAGECDDGWQECKEGEPCAARKLQLQQLVYRHPEQLACLVQDAAWAVTVQNLSPCDYSAMVVSCAGGGGGSQAAVCSTARLLAVIMGPRRFTVRHVLAAVRNLHNGNLCMEVLRQTVHLAGDLPVHRAWLEQQIDETEMIHLQSALTRC